MSFCCILLDSVILEFEPCGQFWNTCVLGKCCGLPLQFALGLWGQMASSQNCTLIPLVGWVSTPKYLPLSLTSLQDTDFPSHLEYMTSQGCSTGTQIQQVMSPFLIPLLVFLQGFLPWITTLSVTRLQTFTSLLTGPPGSKSTANPLGRFSVTPLLCSCRHHSVQALLFFHTYCFSTLLPLCTTAQIFSEQYRQGLNTIQNYFVAQTEKWCWLSVYPSSLYWHSKPFRIQSLLWIQLYPILISLPPPTSPMTMLLYMNMPYTLSPLSFWSVLLLSTNAFSLPHLSGGVLCNRRPVKLHIVQRFSHALPKPKWIYPSVSSDALTMEHRLAHSRWLCVNVMHVSSSLPT